MQSLYKIEGEKKDLVLQLDKKSIIFLHPLFQKIFETRGVSVELFLKEKYQNKHIIRMGDPQYSEAVIDHFKFTIVQKHPESYRWEE